MRLVLVTPATFEPFEVEEIKVRPELRITGSNDDLTLASFIRSAVQTYEDYTEDILCQSTWDLYLDAFPEQIELPMPLSSVTSITYYDSTNTGQTLAKTVYTYDTTGPVRGRVVLRYGQSWPTTYDEINVVIVRFVAGYADPSDIPPRIKDGLMLKIQELYDGIDRHELYHDCWIANRMIPI